MFRQSDTVACFDGPGLTVAFLTWNVCEKLKLQPLGLVKQVDPSESDGENKLTVACQSLHWGV